MQGQQSGSLACRHRALKIAWPSIDKLHRNGLCDRPHSFAAFHCKDKLTVPPSRSLPLLLPSLLSISNAYAQRNGDEDFVSQHGQFALAARRMQHWRPTQATCNAGQSAVHNIPNGSLGKRVTYLPHTKNMQPWSVSPRSTYSTAEKPRPTTANAASHTAAYKRA